MARRTSNAEKNAQNADKYRGKQLAATNASITKVNDIYDKMRGAWKKGVPAGGDVYVGNDRSAPRAIFTPKKGGGGTWKTPDGGERKVRKGENPGLSMQDILGSTSEKPASEGQVIRDTVTGEVEKALGADNPISKFVKFRANEAGTAAAIDALTEDMGPAETPRNAAQWLMNALSTGTYVGARAAEGIGAAYDATLKRGKEAEKRGEYLPLNGLQGVGESVVNAVGGAARGLAEGAGFRFDGERPRTWGQNLEDLGTEDALKGALGDQAGGFTQGLVGTAADIALDPATYVTLGLSGAAKGAARGAREAAQEASTLAGKTVRGLEGGLKGAATGAAARREQILNARLDRSIAADQRRAARTAEPVVSPTTVDDLVPTPTTVDEAVTAVPVQRAAASAAPAPTPVPDPAIARTERLLPSLLEQGEPMRVPAQQILDDLTPAPAGVAAPPAMREAIESVVTSGDPRSIRAGMTRLDADPATKAFLDTEVTVASGPKKVRELVRSAARQVAQQTQAADGTVRTPALDELRAALDMGAAVPGSFTPADLEATIARRFPQRAPSGGAPVDVPALADELAAARTPRAQKRILSRTLGFRATRGFDSFDVALDAAIEGRVEAPQMRQMLRALGIRSESKNPETLQGILSTRGRANWERAKASVPTHEDVLAAHSVSRTLDETSDSIDLEGAQATMAAETAQAMRETFGFDPTMIAPKSGSATARAVHSATKQLGEMFAKGNPVDSYADTAMIAVHKTVMRELGLAARGLSGFERANALYPRYIRALNLIEHYQRGLGILPRFTDARATNPLYVSWGQLVEALPEDLAKLVLFSPVGGRSTRAAEEGVGFVNGLSLYVNHIANGVKAAIGGADAQTVARLMLTQSKQAETAAKKAAGAAGQAGIPTWATTPNGRALVNQLAQTLTDPAFLARIIDLDAAQAPLAVGASKAAADAITVPIGERVIAALETNIDRGGLNALIDRAWREGEAAAKPAVGERLLLDDLVRQRLDSAFVEGILGEEGYLLRVGDQRLAQAATRGESSTARVAVLEDAQANIDASMDDFWGPGVGAEVRSGVDVPDQLRAVLDDYHSMTLAMNGPERLWTRFAVANSGRYGQAELHTLRVAAEETALNFTGAFRTSLKGYVEGLPRQLQNVLRLNRRADTAEVEGWVNRTWRALAAVRTQLGVERWADPEAVAAALGRGQQAAPGRGILEGFDAMEPDEIALAMQLRGYIDQIFDAGGTGPLSRIAVPAEELRRASYNFPDEFADYKVDGKVPLADQLDVWTSFHRSGKPLDLLAAYQQALSHATIEPSIGASMSRVFGESATGARAKELYAQGWRRLDTDRSAGVGRYAEPTTYFPPEILKQMTFVNEYLRAIRQPIFANHPTMKGLLRAHDAMMHAWKSSATIWRPGHHVTNMLGEAAVNLMHGVNPLQAYRAMKMLNGSGAFRGEMDLSRLAALAGEAGTDGRFARDGVQLSLADGSVVDLSLAEVLERALDNGVALTHTAVRDLQDDILQKVTARPNAAQLALRPLQKADQFLGQVSAVRDNVFRLSHFLHELEGIRGRNVDAIVTEAARRIHDAHPTMRTLGATEQRVHRRIFGFYSWVRQAIGFMLRTAADNPGLVTMPSKFQYNMAEAAGLAPESIGQPMPTDGEDRSRIPSWYSQGLLGPTLTGGEAPPIPGVNDGGSELWGYSLSTPQIDAIMTLFEGVTVKPEDEAGNIGNLATGFTSNVIGGNLAPLPRAAAGLLGFRTPQDENKEVGQIAFDQLGAVTAAARAIDTGDNVSIYGRLFPESAAGEDTPIEQRRGDMARYGLNFLTGLKSTRYTTPAGEKRAKQEFDEEAKKRLRRLDLDDDQRSLVRDLLWSQYSGQPLDD